MARISEKSLEMNINENLIRIIRNWGDSFSRTFIYGYTLREEARLGFDSSINLPNSSFYLFALQYKAPKAKRYSTYYFEINNDRRRLQHYSLFISNIIYGNVWYAFPLFISTRELAGYSPNFLERTCFASVDKFPLDKINMKKIIIGVDSWNCRIIIFYSKEYKIEGEDGKKFLENLREKLMPISISKIKEKKLSWNEIYSIVERLGIDKKYIDRIRVKKGRRYYRIKTGFFY